MATEPREQSVSTEVSSGTPPAIVTKKVLVRMGGLPTKPDWPGLTAPLVAAISHGIGFDFPHSCRSNDIVWAYLAAMDGVFGTQTMDSYPDRD
jgi:hypothetical protein